MPGAAPDPGPSPSATAAGQAAGTLRWALDADPTSLDPRRIVRDADAVLVDALFDSLTRLGRDLTAEAALASSWRSDERAETFWFDLAPTAQWHDGTAVVAGDVVRGLRRVADETLQPMSLHGSLLRDVVGYSDARVGGALRGVVAESDTTVRIDLSRPVPELPELLAHPALAPVPQAAIDDPAAFGESPLGNGPFTLAEPWAHNQFLRLAPVAGSAPGIDEIIFRVYAADDAGTLRIAALQAGQVQVTQRAPLPLEGAGGDGLPEGATARDGLTDTMSMLMFDTLQPPFDDERFRRGVSLLIDREALAQRTAGQRTPATALVPPSLPGARRNVCAWCRYDPDTADALIATVLEERAAAGAAPLRPIVIQTSDDAIHGTLADQLSAALRGAGLEVRVVRAGARDYLDLASDEQAAVVRLGWAPLEPTLRAWTDDLFGAGSVGARLTGWQPGPLRDLLARAANAADPAVRRTSWQQVERLALDAAVVAPVLFYRDDLLVADTVAGLERDPFGNVDLTAIRLRGGTP